MKNPTTHDTKNMTHCPICLKLTAHEVEHYPFCSARCKQIDLGRWIDEKYKVSRPVEQRDLEEGVD